MALRLKDFLSIAERRKALEKELNKTFPMIGRAAIDEERASKAHCENMIGSAQIPLGVAGPLPLHGVHVEGSFFLPLATTEGALVASISRGCKVISLAGGATTIASYVGQTRGPVFSVASIHEGRKVALWVESHKKEIAAVAEMTSKHIRYKGAVVRTVGKNVFIRLSFDTQDAMGMNMVTLATEAIAAVIEENTAARLLAVAGNFDIDKKPAWLNVIHQRGICVLAEVCVTKEIVNTVLKTTPQAIFDVWLSKCMVGSAMSGSLGFNAHFANVVAAMFLATGQDPAHVVEASMGITTAQVTPDGDLYMSVYLPSLSLGSIGGGTMLGTQQEALDMLGCLGGGKVMQLAEIVGGAVLAGEISLLASLAEGTLGHAHKRYGRLSQGGKK